MAGRPGRRRLDHSSPLVDLDAVFVDDAMIDDIAARPWMPASRNRFASGRGVGPAAGSARPIDPMADLFTTWRQELAVRPMPEPLTSRQIAAVLERSQQRPQRSVRALRPALSVAAAIAALVIGSTTVGSKDAVPGSPLWGMTQVLWPELAEATASRYEVRDALAEAQSAIEAGNDRDAALALLRATAGLAEVDDVQARGAMQQQVDKLLKEVAPGDSRSVAATGEQSADVTPSMSTSSASSTPPSTSGPAALAAQLAALPGDSVQVVTEPRLVEPPRPAAGNAAPPLLTDSPTIPVTSGSVTAPTTDPPSPVESSSAADAPTASSPPSTVPPPSVPIAPTTPAPTTGDATSQSAPAQSAPLPTPSSPGASEATEATAPVATSPAASALAQGDAGSASSSVSATP